MTQATDSQFEPFTGLPVPTVGMVESGWQARFLATPLLRRLAPVHWQQLLQGLRVASFSAGDTVIEARTPGADCYVLQSGRARVHAGSVTLAILEPGALFGEDALITGGLRNASVAMLTEGRVGALPAERFERWLLNAVIRPLPRIGSRTALCIDDVPPRGHRCLHVPLARIRDPAIVLSASTAYCVVGRGLRERWLAAFVFAQQGHDALPLGDDAGA